MARTCGRCLAPWPGRQRDVADRPATEADLANAFEEGTLRVPVRGEEAVARKETVVTGEVVIDKTRTTETQRVTDTIRKERVDVDDDYERHRADYQRAYAGRPDATAHPYSEAEPTASITSGTTWATGFSRCSPTASLG